METKLEMMQRLTNWYKTRHPMIAESIDNSAINPKSEKALQELIKHILKPIEREFGEIIITYGFTSSALKKYIQKNSPRQTAPELDQHSSYELNSRGKPICSRLGAACDFNVKGYELKMDVIAKYIITHLPFDRLYFYSPQNALHVSIGPEHNRIVQMMKLSDKGHFVPSKRASGEKALYLFE